MKSLRTLDFEIHYEGAAAYLRTFLIPSLTQGCLYKRATGYFTVGSLISVAQGLEVMLMSGGRVELLIGLHDLSEELVVAQRRSDQQQDSKKDVSNRLAQLVHEIGSLSDALKLQRLETLTSLIAGGHLSVKFAKPISVNSQHIFHVKRFVIEDENGDFVCATGSPNETTSGAEGNFEELSTFKSWEDLSGHALKLKTKFDHLWSGENANVEIVELAQADFETLESAVRKRMAVLGVTLHDEQQSKQSLVDSLTSFIPAKLFQFKGTRLYPHQEVAYLKALSRWPIRVLLADEVGLGKTLEVGATLIYLKDVAKLKSAIVLAPKSVVNQLQEELAEKFGLDFLVWNSSKQQYVGLHGHVSNGIYGPPGSLDAPDWLIASSQWARGTSGRGHIFHQMDRVPDILIVDEAHSARVPPPEQKASPSLLYQALEVAAEKIPHVILMTATPMQLHVAEYHGLLRLLGLPKTWQKLKNFELALKVQAKGVGSMTLNEAKDIAHLARDASMIAKGSAAGSPVDFDLRSDVQFANRMRKNWGEYSESFVQLNPATQLTVRNTRSSLEKFGYKFPGRNFTSPEIVQPLALLRIKTALDDYLRFAYGKLEEILTSEGAGFSKGFVVSIYEQRFASSLWSLKKSLDRRKEKLESIYLNTEPAPEFDDDDLFEDGNHGADSLISKPLVVTELVRSSIQNELNYLEDVLSEICSVEGGPILGDPKLSTAGRVIASKVNNGHRVIVFSRYTDTLDSLLEVVAADASLALNAFGFYSGRDCWVQRNGLKSTSTKHQLQQALAAGEIDFILCSDAASEGINLQSASVLINVDVPWNPSRLEQRIGRIARLGQKASIVDIVNLWYPNSVEALMYTRLLNRKELYDLAVGAFPDLFAKGIREMVSLQGSGNVSFSGDAMEKLEEMRERSYLEGLAKLWDTDFSGLAKSTIYWERLERFFASIGLPLSETEGADFEALLNAPSQFGHPDSNATLFRLHNAFGTWGFELHMHDSGENLALGLGELPQLLDLIFRRGYVNRNETAALVGDWSPIHDALDLTNVANLMAGGAFPQADNLVREVIGTLRLDYED